MNVFGRCAVVIAGATVMSIVTAQAPRAEVGLLGVKLYDTGVNVVKKFGSPTDVVAVTFGQTNAGGGGGGSASRGPAAGGGGTPAGGGGRAGAEFTVPPLGINQARRPVVAGGESSTASAPAGGGPGGGGAGGSQGTMEVQFVRWIYQRGSGSSVNFVLNKFNKVVQIEAIGIVDGRVRTLRNVSLGSTLADVVKKYGDPDGYDVGGDYFMVKYLSKYKCAFRFTRESAKTPYRITSIIVSAGRA